MARISARYPRRVRSSAGPVWKGASALTMGGGGRAYFPKLGAELRPLDRLNQRNAPPPTQHPEGGNPTPNKERPPKTPPPTHTHAPMEEEAPFARLYLALIRKSPLANAISPRPVRYLNHRRQAIWA